MEFWKIQLKEWEKEKESYVKAYNWHKQKAEEMKKKGDEDTYKFHNDMAGFYLKDIRYCEERIEMINKVLSGELKMLCQVD